MLVITRKLGEAIKIGDLVTVTVLHIKSNQIRLGVSAPRQIGVDREEIWKLKAIQAKPRLF